MNATMSVEAGEALAHTLVVLGDNKYRLGLRYAEWCNSAPTLEAAIAAAAMTQDELGHARSIYAVVQGLANPPDVFNEDEAARDTFLNMACLDRSFMAWADFVAANSIPDQMMTVMFEAALESSYVPIAQRAAKIIQEEQYHFMYAQGWCAQLARHDASRKMLIASAQRMWPEVMAWFGPQDDQRLELLYNQGVLDADGPTLRSRFEERVNQLLGAHGFEPPVADIQWDSWDAQSRRFVEA